METTIPKRQCLLIVENNSITQRQYDNYIMRMPQDAKTLMADLMEKIKYNYRPKCQCNFKQNMQT